MSRLTEAQRKRFRFISFDLDKVAAKRRNCHWISTPDGDNGYEWCPTCVYYKVRNLRRHDRRRREDYRVDGGWRTEHDSFPICHGCGAFLDGSLTEYGAREEIEYYRSSGLSTRADVDALYLSEIAGALNEDDEEAPFVFSMAKKVLKAAGRAALEDATRGRGE